jgi:hypothetical protein
MRPCKPSRSCHSKLVRPDKPDRAVQDFGTFADGELCGSLYVETVFGCSIRRVACASTGEKPASTSWPVMPYGGGEPLVRGGRTGPRVDVDGFGEGECECH